MGSSAGVWLVCLLLLPLISSGSSALPERWDFEKINDLKGWSLPQDVRGVVMGGSLWLSLASPAKDGKDMANTVGELLGDAQDRRIWVDKRYLVPKRVLLTSPSGLNVSAPAPQQLQVRLRVLNLSPVTDFFLEWSGAQAARTAPGSRRCSLEADLKEWQTVTCYAEKDWPAPIDRIALAIPSTVMRGDLWISRIEIAAADPEPVRARPDLASRSVVPRLRVPGIAQADFTDAFRVLDECLAVEVPLYGFTYPVLTPDAHGATYGESWWEEDASVAIGGAQWANPRFAENVMRGFRDVQAANPDGHIDALAWGAFHGQVTDVSQEPLLFEAAYEVARRTDDGALREEIFELMRKYLDWWLSPVKRDARTGLVTGVAEESFGQTEDFTVQPQTYAPVDLNVWVALGATWTADLACSLHREEACARYRQVFREQAQAINRFLWDEGDGAYYEYDLRSNTRTRKWFVAAFYPLRAGIASSAQRDRLLEPLLDPEKFNWGKVPLTTLAMTEAEFKRSTLRQTPDSDYNFTGDVWAVTTMPVILGLEEAGREDLAAELSWAMIKAFNAHYREALIPMTGEGLGATRYAESAALYIQAIVEHLFGIDYDAIRGRLRIRPHVPRALYGKTLAIDDVILPTGADTRLSVQVKRSSTRAAVITVDIHGALPPVMLDIEQSGSGQKVTSAAARNVIARFPRVFN